MTMTKPRRWLDRLINSKPTAKPQERCTCGRYSGHTTDKTAQLIAELSAQGRLPARFAAAGKAPAIRGQA